MEQSGERGGLEGSLESSAQPPRYPNLYPVTGTSGAGKSTLSESVKKLMNDVVVWLSSTDKPPRYPGDDTHEFISLEEMTTRINSTAEPNRILWVNRGYRYFSDYEKIKHVLGNGSDVIFPTGTRDAVEQILNAHKQAHVIWVMARGKQSIERMASDNRPKSEIDERTEIDSESWGYYDEIGRSHGSIIQNWYPGVLKEARLLVKYREFLKNHNSRRIAHLISWARNHRHADLPPVEIHPRYVKAVEDAISGLGKPLQEDQRIALPTELIVSYNSLQTQLWEKYKGLRLLCRYERFWRAFEHKPEPLPTVETVFKVAKVSNNEGVRSISILLEGASVPSRLDLLGLMWLYLKQKGLEPADIVAFPVDVGANPMSFSPFFLDQIETDPYITTQYYLPTKRNKPEENIIRDMRLQFRLTDYKPSGLDDPSAAYAANIKFVG